MRTLYSGVHVVEAVAYDTYTTGTNEGTTVDTAFGKNNFRDVLFVVNAELSGDAGTHTFTIEESANDSDWVPAVATRVQGTVPVISTANDNAVHYFGYRPTLRYVRLVNTSASAATGLDVAAVAVLASGSDNPPART